jgi:hypothetical protein
VLGLAPGTKIDLDARYSPRSGFAKPAKLEKPGLDDDVSSRARAIWEVLKPALAEWQNLLDEVFPAILDWAGPLQPEWLRRLAFGVN